MAGITANVRLGLIVAVTGRLNVLSGRCVGPSASKGIFFRLVRKALHAGTEPDFQKWLSHSRPQVRALGVVCLCLRQPADLEAAVSPLLSDEAIVTVRPIGCFSSKQTLAHFTKRLLADPTYLGHRSDLRH